MHSQAVRNQRTHRRLVSGTTIASVEAYGPDRQIAKTPVFLYDATSDLADVTLLPDERGLWTLLGRDGGGAIVATDQFECDLTLPEWAAYGLKPYEGNAFSYPTLTMAAGSDLSGSAITTGLTYNIASGGATTTIQFASSFPPGSAFSPGQTVKLNGGTPESRTVVSYDSGTGVLEISGTNGTTHTSVVSNANPVRSFISKGKVVIPWDCTIYGMQILVSSGNPLNNADSWRLFTINVQGATQGYVRSISDNVKNLTPAEGSWAGGGWKTVWFRKPLVGRLGDWWGFEIDDTSALGETIACYYQTSTANVITAGQQVNVLNAALNLSPTTLNTFGAYGSVTGQIQIRLYLSPPAVGICGLSHWAGSGASATGAASASIYTDAPIGPNRTRDLAFLLQEQLGLPVANLAQGSTDIRNWVGPASFTQNITSGGATTALQLATPYPPASDFAAGQLVRLFGGTTEYRTVSSYNATTGILTISGTNGTTHTTVTYTPLNNGIATGLFENIVVPIHPALVVFDTVYNDCQAGFGQESLPGFTSADYLTYLDRLLAHADQAGIELAILEAFGSLFAVQNNTSVGNLDFSAQIEKLNGLVRGWCERNGVLYIPLNWRLGQYDGTKNEHRSRRYAQKRYNTNFPRYGLPDYQATDVVHLTEQGRKAAAAGIAAALKNRAPRSGRETASRLADLSPPDGALEALRQVADLVGLNQVLRDTSYDGSGNLTGATIRVYDTAANATTDDGATGLLASYSLANTFSSGNLSKQVTGRAS